MNQEKQKKLRQFIARKALERPSQQAVSGEDVAKMIAAIRKIDDQGLRTRLEGELQIHPKYVFLQRVAAENGELMKTDPGAAWEIINNGTEIDYAVEHDPPAVINW